MEGTGYGDRDFEHKCSKCEKPIHHKLLRVCKFIKDSEALILNDWPLGGTILAHNGTLAVGTDKIQTGFVNRLIQIALRVDILELMEKHESPTMTSVKGLIERSLPNKDVIRKVNLSGPLKGSTIASYERTGIRKMMSRYVSPPFSNTGFGSLYMSQVENQTSPSQIICSVNLLTIIKWDNSSIFTLELGGAVMRQSVFVEKMHDLDWLHSPAARDTMKRLLTKYSRFINLIAENPGQTGVPTLDVDLGWHTHRMYYIPSNEVGFNKDS